MPEIIFLPDHRCSLVQHDPRHQPASHLQYLGSSAQNIDGHDSILLPQVETT